MPKKKPTIRDGLYNLLSSVQIQTKELGRTRVEPWLSQRIIIDQVTQGLAEGVHEFAILKCRQVAASTTCGLIALFWCLVYPGVQAGLIADRGDNLERFRRIFASFLESLPDEWRGPEHALLQNNRFGLRFANESVLDLLAAGNNPDLGSSRALNFLHATECSLWRSLPGVESLRASLARENPNRLYLFESVANGFNWWFNYCNECKQDPHKRFIFLGFWANPNYWINQDDDDYKTFLEVNPRTGEFKLMDNELRWAQFVHQHYNYVVKPEQIAWWRRESEFRAEEAMFRHYPWHEEQAFVSTGLGFFPAKRTLQVAHKLAERPPLFKAYRYTFDDDFLRSRIDMVSDPDEANLRVWEEPAEDGVYVIGVDPSGGGGGDSDDHAVEVFRCYADRIVQVCEFQSNRPLTYQIAWVMCHLAGAYPQHTCNLEVSGIGAAVMPEIRNLRLLYERGWLQAEPQKDHILDRIGRIRWYLYSREDSLTGPSSIIAWKMNPDNKAQIFSEVRDALQLDQLEIRSPRLLKQMQGTITDQGYIGADETSGEKDDLVVATCLAVHIWSTTLRLGLINQGTTWDRVHTPPITNNPSMVLSEAFSRHMMGVWIEKRQERERF